MEAYAQTQGPPEPVALPAGRVIEQVRDHAMFCLDRHGRATSWNEGVREILGWERHEWIGQPSRVAFLPDDVAAGVPERELQQAAATGRGGDDRWMRRKNGERFFAVGAVTGLRDDAGALVGFVKVLRDFGTAQQAIDERERLLQAERSARADALSQQHELSRVATLLHERDAQLRALVSGVRDYAIFTLDPQGRIASWHEGAARMKGYTAEEAIGMPFANLFSAEDRAEGRPQFELDEAARTGEFKGEGPRRRKDGSSFDAAVVLTALRGSQGELLGYLKLTQDISARKRQDRERDETLRIAHATRAAAERASHSKGEFLATISHELRTPLGAILGWAHVLEHGLSDPEVARQGLAAITRNARVQVQLMEDLLDMSRIEAGQMRLDMQPVELAGVIAAAVDSALPAATTKNISMRTVLDPAAGTVLGDPDRLQQIIWNLLSNAVKFTPAGGRVSVSLARAGAAVEVGVSDSGQGIEAEFLPLVFDRFQQQDATTTRRHGGLGIGLAIVRQLAQLHGGSVRAQSAGTDRGATFTVTLPTIAAPAWAKPFAAPSEDGQAPPGQPAAEPQRLDGIAVLLIDDEPDGRAMAERVLRDAGAEVRSAASAQEGFELYRQHRFQAILSDIGMPVHDGYDFLRWVRGLEAENGRHTAAAAFTAYARPEDRQRALAVGYEMHLVKPLEPSALIAAVASLAGAHQAA